MRDDYERLVEASRDTARARELLLAMEKSGIAPADPPGVPLAQVAAKVRRNARPRQWLDRIAAAPRIDVSPVVLTLALAVSASIAALTLGRMTEAPATVTSGHIVLLVVTLGIALLSATAIGINFRRQIRPTTVWAGTVSTARRVAVPSYARGAAFSLVAICRDRADRRLAVRLLSAGEEVSSGCGHQMVTTAIPQLNEEMQVEVSSDAPATVEVSVVPMPRWPQA